MSLYERKLEKLEELAGLRECSHPHTLQFIAPNWFTTPGEEPFSWTMCQHCKATLHQSSSTELGRSEVDRRTNYGEQA